MNVWLVIPLSTLSILIGCVVNKPISQITMMQQNLSKGPAKTTSSLTVSDMVPIDTKQDEKIWPEVGVHSMIMGVVGSVRIEPA